MVLTAGAPAAGALAVATLTLLAACDPGQPSHLPAPAELSGAAIGSGIDNALYNARRKRVSAFVHENYNALVAEIAAGRSTLAHAGMDIAHVPAASRPALLAELRSHPEIYLSGDPERIVVAFMVHGR